MKKNQSYVVIEQVGNSYSEAFHALADEINRIEDPFELVGGVLLHFFGGEYGEFPYLAAQAVLITYSDD